MQNSIPFLTFMYFLLQNSKYYGEFKKISLDKAVNIVIRSHAVPGFRKVIILVDTQIKALNDHNLVGKHMNVASR